MIEHIRDYRVLSKLGEGGMGTVYLAEDSMLERKVAIKVLNPALTQDMQFVDRFRQEAKVQSTLIHPNIVSLHTFFQESGMYCMIMEYAEGETLKRLLERSGALPPSQAIAIAAKILEGVGYAHSKGIVHRDLKPGNIMIGTDGSVKVMDFGIAKIIGEKGMTRTGTKMGTIYYMSPEQVKALKDIDGRTDIYSIGITLYEMISGRLPFNTDTESEFEVMQQIVEGELPPLRHSGVSVPEVLERAIEGATRKDRKQRVQTCSEFLGLLHGRTVPSPARHVSEPAVAPSWTALPASAVEAPGLQHARRWRQWLVAYLAVLCVAFIAVSQERLLPGLPLVAVYPLAVWLLAVALRDLNLPRVFRAASQTGKPPTRLVGLLGGVVGFLVVLIPGSIGVSLPHYGKIVDEVLFNTSVIFGGLLVGVPIFLVTLLVDTAKGRRFRLGLSGPLPPAFRKTLVASAYVCGFASLIMVPATLGGERHSVVTVVSMESVWRAGVLIIIPGLVLQFCRPPRWWTGFVLAAGIVVLLMQASAALSLLWPGPVVFDYSEMRSNILLGGPLEFGWQRAHLAAGVFWAFVGTQLKSTTPWLKYTTLGMGCFMVVSSFSEIGGLLSPAVSLIAVFWSVIVARSFQKMQIDTRSGDVVGR